MAQEQTTYNRPVEPPEQFATGNVHGSLKLVLYPTASLEVLIVGCSSFTNIHCHGDPALKHKQERTFSAKPACERNRNINEE
eukprot:2992989-Pyramimonas_sp.AAC.2